MALTLAELRRAIPELTWTGSQDIAVDQVTSDSRQAGPGVLFVAVVGSGGDGHDYLAAAAAAGSPAAVVHTDRLTEPVSLSFAAVATVPDTRPLPALLARCLAGDPDRQLLTAAVTGTNGKTTVSFLMREMLERLHGPCGLMGTIRYQDGREQEKAPLTTPGGPVFYRWLERMVHTGCRSVAMELSSHALDQDRTAGLGLDVGIMTNLGRDHLDYHCDLATYLAAKARIRDLLRTEEGGGGPLGRPGTLVLNAADPRLADLATGDCRVVRFDATGKGAVAADLCVDAAALEPDGTRLDLTWRRRRLRVFSPLVGRFNVENLTAALAAGLALGFAPEDCAEALTHGPQVPGRMERFALPSGGLAVVDYAHTADALAAVLAAAAELVSGRLLTVFGCGGDRDRGKRPLMGEAAAQGADRIWITTDNPRGEAPAAICAEVETGVRAAAEPRAAGHEVVLDRRTAIEAALAATGPGDVVVVAGKGHEDYQIVGDRILDLDDRRIVRSWIERRDGNG